MNSPSPDQLVTASDLVRHFGFWQDRAARAPVYVMHRGRARLVMTSVDLMDALCAPHSHDAARSDVDALLSGMREAVIIADRDLCVIAVSRAGSAMLGAGAAPGVTIARAWPSPHDFIAEAARRVAGSGIAESIEAPSPRDADRRHVIVIEPLTDGIALFGRDITSGDLLAEELAGRRALADGLAALGRIAIVRIGPRGFVERPEAALAAMTALALDALSSVRFASLFAIGSRAAIGEAFEAVMQKAVGATLDAKLLVNRAEPVNVRIALTPIVRGPVIEAVNGLILVAD